MKRCKATTKSERKRAEKQIDGDTPRVKPTGATEYAPHRNRKGRGKMTANKYAPAHTQTRRSESTGRKFKRGNST